MWRREQRELQSDSTVHRRNQSGNDGRPKEPVRPTQFERARRSVIGQSELRRHPVSPPSSREAKKKFRLDSDVIHTSVPSDDVFTAHRHAHKLGRRGGGPPAVGGEIAAREHFLFDFAADVTAPPQAALKVHAHEESICICLVTCRHCQIIGLLWSLYVFQVYFEILFYLLILFVSVCVIWLVRYRLRCGRKPLFDKPDRWWDHSFLFFNMLRNAAKSESQKVIDVVLRATFLHRRQVEVQPEMNSPWCGLLIFCWQLTVQRGITPPQTWRPVRSHFDHFCVWNFGVSVNEHNDLAMKCQIIQLQTSVLHWLLHTHTHTYLSISCIYVLCSNVCCSHALFGKGRFAACAHSVTNLTHGKIPVSLLAECLQLSDSEPQFGPDVSLFVSWGEFVQKSRPSLMSQL